VLITTYFSEDMYLEVDEKKIIWFTSRRGINGIEGVVVPGIVASSKYKTENGAVVIDVEPVKDEGLRKKITDALKEKGPISFWPL
jgi:hypothetical protein